MTFFGLAEGGGEEIGRERPGGGVFAGAGLSARRGAASVRVGLGAGEAARSSDAARAGRSARGSVSAARRAPVSDARGEAFGEGADVPALSTFVSATPGAAGAATVAAASLSRSACVAEA